MPSPFWPLSKPVAAMKWQSSFFKFFPRNCPLFENHRTARSARPPWGPDGKMKKIVFKIHPLLKSAASSSFNALKHDVFEALNDSSASLPNFCSCHSLLALTKMVYFRKIVYFRMKHSSHKIAKIAVLFCIRLELCHYNFYTTDAFHSDFHETKFGSISWQVVIFKQFPRYFGKIMT